MNKWKPLFKEDRGTVKNKVWVTDGMETALFKPDSDLKESIIECMVAEIAEKLGISCAKVEQIELFGSNGILSYNFKNEKGMTYCPADLVYAKAGGYTHLSRDSNNSILKKLPSLSVEFVKNNIPVLQEEMVRMLFLDCLVSNKDRHGGNWEIMMTEEHEATGIAPLFDHGMSMQNDYYGMLDDYCIVPWKEGGIELLHFDMFEKLSIYYPVQVAALIEKSRDIDLDEFTAGRFERMCSIQKEIAKIQEVLEKAGIAYEPWLVEKIREINKVDKKVVAMEEIKEMYDNINQDAQKEAVSKNQMSLDEWKNTIKDEKKSREETGKDGIEKNYSR